MCIMHKKYTKYKKYRIHKKYNRYKKSIVCIVVVPDPPVKGNFGGDVPSG